MHDNQFKYSDERFADLQMLRYRLNGFESLSLSQKLYIFCLAKATLMGRDITFDQQGKYNLRIRKLSRPYTYIIRFARRLRVTSSRKSLSISREYGSQAASITTMVARK